MAHVTLFYLILFILTFNELSESASVIRDVISTLDLEKSFVDKLLMGKVHIVNTDMMDYKSDTPSADSLKSVKLWNPKEPIPIYVSKELSKQNTDAIVNALNEIQNNSCLRFKNAQKSDMKTGVIVFQDGDGCYSFLGKKEGAQAIVLANEGCGYTGIGIHETLHALGLFHEHQRSDRDNYVKIITYNIEYEFENQFYKATPSQDHILGPYDYGSIMHYASDAFARRPNLTTIQPLKEGVVLVPVHDKDKLSKLDAQKLNKLYDCESLNKTADLIKPFILKREYK